MGKIIKIVWWLFLTCLIVWFAKWCSSKTDERVLESLKTLRNDVEFRGIVKNKALSNNHGFGIVELGIIESNVDYFNQEKFPYRIEQGVGELYSTISSVEIGDTVRIVSNDGFFYYNYNNRIVKGEIHILSPLNISYIEKHTIFK